MKLLPFFAPFLVVLFSCALGNEGASDSGDARCPGLCVNNDEACDTILSETDCGSEQLCCIDHLEGDLVDRYGWEKVERGYEYESVSGYTEQAQPEAEIGSDEYDPSYSEESASESGNPYDSRCPGSCVPAPYSDYCEYMMTEDDLCEPSSTCCVTERVANKLSGPGYSAPPREMLMKRSDIDESCPGICVHPSQTIYCDKVLPGYGCPGSSRCCIRRPTQKTVTAPVLDCTGQCLAFNMRRYCIQPNELITGRTTCAPGTTCCMNRSGMRMPATTFPGMDYQQNVANAPVLGHLAMDENGNIFRVSLNGQISPLPRLTNEDHSRYAYNKLADFERANGVVVVYSDNNGIIYQQFMPRQMSTGFSNVQRPPMFRQPINQFEPQASEHAKNFQATSEPSTAQIPDFTEAPTEQDDSDKVVIPEEGDEPAAVRVSHVPMKESNPKCPGSCMSYFLRFTCFRGNAIYDGFACPGRQVCCARLQDIEEHEEYLKSLSPYFNSPPALRDPALPRCGIKGRRDTPRAVGGKEAMPGEWCWQVAVINVHNQYICGGALIDNSWVLTAAHCVAGPTKENKALYVRAGVTDLRSPEDNGLGQTVRVLSTFIHHNFKHQNLDNDVALLRLQKPFDLGTNICVICLPTTGLMPEVNTKCTVTGYGFVSDNQMSLNIHQVEVPIVDDMDCMTNVTEGLTHPFLLPASSFCAGGFGQKDACQGDAGGPLACEVNGYHELIGLVSWGLGCTRNDVPSIFVKVPAFMGWINQIISSSSFLMSLN